MWILGSVEHRELPIAMILPPRAKQHKTPDSSSKAATSARTTAVRPWSHVSPRAWGESAAFPSTPIQQSASANRRASGGSSHPASASSAIHRELSSGACSVTVDLAQIPSRSTRDSRCPPGQLLPARERLPLRPRERPSCSPHRLPPRRCPAPALARA